MSDDDDFYRYTKDQLEAEHKNKIALGLLPPSKKETPATDWQSRALSAEAARDKLVETLKKSRKTFAALGVQEEINRIDDILAKIKGDAK